MILREEWEQPGWTIGEHTNSGPMRPEYTSRIVIHYPGGGSFPDDPSDDWVKSYSQAMQRDYAGNRGYSIGYNVGVMKNGKVVQWRDLDYMCAANGRFADNYNSFAIQLANETGRAATPAQIAAVRDQIARVQRWAGKKLNVIGHRDVKPTSCPGEQIYAQVTSGVFDVPYLKEYITVDALTFVNPERLFDQSVAAQTQVVIPAPMFARALKINVTAAGAAESGHVRAWGSGGLPETSVLNFGDSHASANQIDVPCPDGSVRLWTSRDVRLIVDLVGWWS